MEHLDAPLADRIPNLLIQIGLDAINGSLNDFYTLRTQITVESGSIYHLMEYDNVHIIFNGERYTASDLDKETLDIMIEQFQYNSMMELL